MFLILIPGLISWTEAAPSIREEEQYTGFDGTARGGTDWMLGKGSFPGVEQALEQIPQAVVMVPSCQSSISIWTKLSEIFIFGGSVWSQKLDSMMFVGLFHLVINYDSTIL